MDWLLQRDVTKYSLSNAHIVTPTKEFFGGTLRIENGIITDISDKQPYTDIIAIDMHHNLIVPGFIDIHGDSLERALCPRPGVLFPFDIVLPSYDTEIASHGITMMYHCVAVSELGSLTKPLRYRNKALEIIDALDRFKNRSKTKTRIHLRYEILDRESIHCINRLIGQKKIDFLSLTDHTPGFGVFKDISSYKTYLERSGQNQRIAEEEISYRLELRKQIDIDLLSSLVSRCREKDIPCASHDDHTREKIRWAKNLNISIAEFPVTEEAIDEARKNNMFTVFGAANVVRGNSHAGNLSARELIRRHKVDILCSDYMPMTLLQSIFVVKKLGIYSLPDIVNTFTYHPAKALCIDHETGSLETGKKADIIIVDSKGNYPYVAATIVDGKVVFATVH